LRIDRLAEAVQGGSSRSSSKRTIDPDHCSLCSALLPEQTDPIVALVNQIAAEQPGYAGPVCIGCIATIQRGAVKA
jgi:hypothetical protein